MDKKKLSAAMAAVFATIKTTEEAAYIPGAVEPLKAPAPVAQPVPVQYNIWSISGRQTHMQANSMMQMRLFK